MTELERFRQVLKRISVDGCGCSPVCLCHDESTLRIWKEEIQSMVREALNPEPEMEEVPITKWMCRHCDKVFPGDTLYRPCCGSPLVKLTGTFLRAKPVPVERSVSVEVQVCNGAGAFCAGSILSMDNKPLLERFPETYGKRGTITFTPHD